jgi:DNA-binding CsgD family transcriptional regulator
VAPVVRARSLVPPSSTVDGRAFRVRARRDEGAKIPGNYVTETRGDNFGPIVPANPGRESGSVRAFDPSRRSSDPTRVEPGSRRVPERVPADLASDGLPLRDVLDGDPDRGILLFDAELRLAYANPCARAMLHPIDGALMSGLRDAVARVRDRGSRSSAAVLPSEVFVGTDATKRGRATISSVPRPGATWFVVRLSPVGATSEPTVRRLQTRFRLTLREAQVALGVARGLSNVEVAAELEIREKTVKNALMTVFRKCRVRNRVELALRAHDAKVAETA